jgi:hypothetical protein
MEPSPWLVRGRQRRVHRKPRVLPVRRDADLDGEVRSSRCSLFRQGSSTHLDRRDVSSESRSLVSRAEAHSPRFRMAGSGSLEYSECSWSPRKYEDGSPTLSSSPPVPIHPPSPRRLLTRRASIRFQVSLTPDTDSKADSYEFQHSTAIIIGTTGIAMSAHAQIFQFQGSPTRSF